MAGRTCAVCSHPDRAAIDAALVEGQQSERAIARQWRVSRTALQRHRGAHLPAHLAKAKAAVDVAHADTLLTQLVDLQEKASGILTKAEQDGELRTALAAVREVRGCMELLGRLTQQLASGAGYLNVSVQAIAAGEVRAGGRNIDVEDAREYMKSAIASIAARIEEASD